MNHIAYDAFGNVQSESNPVVDHVFGFTGRPWDENTGLYYNRARYYDPLIGRFISEDPSGFASGDTNLYRYAGNSPTNLTDPSGLAPPDEDAVRLLQGFLRSNGGQRDLQSHPHFVRQPNVPGGGFVATVPRYRSGRVVGSQASPDWELVRRQRERDRREQVAAELAQRQVMERAFRRAYEKAQRGTVSFLCADGSTGQMSRNIDPLVAQQLLNSPDGHRVDPSSMHFLGAPYRNGPESLVPSEQELEDRADHEIGRIQAESLGPLAWAKTLFDVLGMIPGAEPFDVLSGSISAFEGNYGEVTMTFAAVAPIGGQLAGMSKLSDRFRTASAAFADLRRGTDRFKDFMTGAGDAIRRYRKDRHDKLVTVYRGMSEEEFEAIERLGKLSSHAQVKGNVNAVPKFWQKWLWHSVDSAAIESPLVSVSGSVGIARHFSLDGIRKGFYGAIQDLMVRTGMREPEIASGKVLAKITVRRGHLQRTLHWAQDELVARGGTPIVSIIKVAKPELAGHLSHRIFIGAATQVSIMGGGGGWALYSPTYHAARYLFNLLDESDNN